jgi:hypothetical protein
MAVLMASGLKTFLQVYFGALPPIGSNIAAEASRVRPPGPLQAA